MGIFFVYILKSSLCLALFYLFYRLLLSRDTFHRFNRIAILGILLISLLIPFCEITIEKQTEVQQTVLTLEQLLLLADTIEETSISDADKSTVTWVQVALVVYFAGILFFVCKNLYSVICLCRMLRKGERSKLGSGKILVVHQRNDIAPFSWMKFIVISAKDLEENGREILIHELAHIRNKHSLDLLVADICIFFQWFNPAAWLLKQELQNIHEYEADETVIKEGIDAKQYQLLLIKKAVGTRLYSMANSFNHSKLKKRITMMLKEKSNPWARLKYLYILPLAAVAITAFARPEVSKELEEISAVKVNDLAAIVETKAVEIQPRDTTIKAILKGESESGIIIRANNLNDNPPLCIVNGEEISYDIMSVIDPQSIESISILKSKRAIDSYGEKGKNGVILVDLKSPEKRIELFSKDKPRTKEPLIVLDGNVMEGLEGIDPNIIKEMRVIKDASQARNDEEKELFKKHLKSLNGVIFITSKKGSNSSDATMEVQGNKITVKGSVAGESGKPVIGASVIISGTNVGTISDLDGNFVLETAEDATLAISYIDMKTEYVKVAPEMKVKLKSDK